MTVSLSVIGILIGLPIGLGLALIRWADVPVLAAIVKVYVSVLRATPLVTLLLLLFFAPTTAGIDVPIPLFDFWRDEIKVVTSYAGSGADLQESLRLISERKVRVGEMVTHRLPLAQTGLGFELTASGQDSIKVIIDPLI